MNDRETRLTHAIIAGTEALVGVLRENRFLWAVAAVYFAGHILTTDSWIVRLIDAGAAALAVWHVVRTWRLIRQGTQLLEKAALRGPAQ